MITKEDLKTLGLEEEKITQALETLGDVTHKLTSDIIVEKRVKKAWDDMDLETLNITKIPKNNDEMSTAYRKRAVEEFTKQQIKKIEEDFNAKIKAAEEAVKNHKGDETLKAELETLKKEKKTREESFEKTLTEKTDEWKTKYEKTVGEYESFKKTSTLKGSIPVNFKKDLPHDYIDFRINKAIEKANTGYDGIDKDKDGNIILKNSEKFESMKASDFFANDLKDILEEKRNQQGGGSSGNGEGSKKELMLEETMTAQEKDSAIRDYVIQVLGLSPISKEYTAKITELKKQHKLISEKVK